MKKKRRGKKVATQLAPTPVITGKEAKKILEAAKKQPSETAKANASKLIQFFNSIEKKGFK